MKPAARVGDDTAHGGKLTSGAPTVLISDRPSVRVADSHGCPQHGPGVVVQGSASVLIANAPASRVGDMCACAAAGSGATGGSAGGGAGGGPTFSHKVEGPKVEVKTNPDKLSLDPEKMAVPGEGLPIKAKATASKTTTEIGFLGMKFIKETTILEGEIESKDGPGEGHTGVSIVKKAGLMLYGDKLAFEGNWELGGYKLNVRDELSAGLGLGASGPEVDAYRRDKDGTLYLGGGAGLPPPLDLLSAKKMITITPPGAGAGGADGAAGAGLPNAIASGDATVLIG